MPSPNGHLHKNRTDGNIHSPVKTVDLPGGRRLGIRLQDILRGIRDGVSQLLGGRRHIVGVKYLGGSGSTGGGGARTK